MSNPPVETTSAEDAEDGKRTFIIALEMPGLRACVRLAIHLETNEGCPGEIHRTDKEWNPASRLISNRELAITALKMAKTATATPHSDRFQ